jgi:hypothetical protein
MDKKSFFIIVLAAALILSFIIRPSKTIDKYEDEINKFKIENDKLLDNYDSLLNINIKINYEIGVLLNDFDSIGIELVSKENEINRLKNGKGKINNYVNALNADGVSSEIAKYINTRRQNKK